MKSKQKMKPHPWSKLATDRIDELYRRAIVSEVTAYKFILSDLVAAEYTEEQFHEAFEDFMRSKPRSYSIRVFRKFLETQYAPGDSAVKERPW